MYASRNISRFKSSYAAKLQEISRIGKLFPVFQPLVPLPWTGETRVIYEMLARIEASEGWILRPDEFLGLQIPVGTIDYAMLRLVPEIQRRFTGTIFTLNAAPSSLRDVEYFDTLRSMLIAHEIIAGCLVIDVTENQEDMLEDLLIADRVDAVRALGVRVALDDFGTGGNGINRLAAGHYDFVKISPALDVSTTRGRILIEGMINILNDLSQLGQGVMNVVVEGIETAEQLDQSIFIGAHYGQGRIICPPSEKIIQYEPLIERINWVTAEFIRNYS